MTIAANTVRVLVVDDHPAVRAGIAGLLDEERDLAPVATASGARDALAAARAHPPDVAVVDYHLAESDGLSLCRALKATDRPPRVLVFSAYADASLALAAVVAGADGMLSKGVLGRELAHCVRALARGDELSLPVSRDALDAAGRCIDPGDLAILGMLVHRVPPGEIATVLRTSESWLEARRWAMLRRLQEPGARSGLRRRPTLPAAATG